VRDNRTGPGNSQPENFGVCQACQSAVGCFDWADVAVVAGYTPKSEQPLRVKLSLHISKPVRLGTIRVVALLLLTAVIWCWQHNRLSLASWCLPLDYAGDSLEILARFKAAAEGDLKPFESHVIHRLGAPFMANWNEYPGSDDITNYGMAWWRGWSGCLRRAIWPRCLPISRLRRPSISAPAAARALEWAAVGALLFAFSFFDLFRRLPHLWLTFTGTVPLALFTCAIVAAGAAHRDPAVLEVAVLRNRRVVGRNQPVQPVPLSAALGLGAAGCMAPFALVAQRPPRARLHGVAVCVFAAIHARMRISVVDEGAAPLLVRNYAGTEIYGLKPIELFVPPSVHRLGWLAALGSRYVRWTDWRGEEFPRISALSVVSV